MKFSVKGIQRWIGKQEWNDCSGCMAHLKKKVVDKVTNFESNLFKLIQCWLYWVIYSVVTGFSSKDTFFRYRFLWVQIMINVLISDLYYYNYVFQCTNVKLYQIWAHSKASLIMGNKMVNIKIWLFFMRDWSIQLYRNTSCSRIKLRLTLTVWRYIYFRFICMSCSDYIKIEES